jgi:hypothetical protein
MSPDDPRHGTYSGRRAHLTDGESPCKACAEANATYQRRYRKIRALYGDRTVPTLGSHRRVLALMSMGWSGEAIAREAGMAQTALWASLTRPSGRIFHHTAANIADAYERMSMTFPPSETRGQRISIAKSRAYAKRNGAAPPLAWDDIDRDPEPQGVVGTDTDATEDEQVVDRILAGDWRLKATPDQRLEVIRRWTADGRSQNELERLTRWNVSRALRTARQKKEAA